MACYFAINELISVTAWGGFFRTETLQPPWGFRFSGEKMKQHLLVCTYMFSRKTLMNHHEPQQKGVYSFFEV